MGENNSVNHDNRLISSLIQQDLPIPQVCGGKGLCATCHVYIKEGIKNLSPITKREKRTLGLIESSNNSSRLACQARIIGDGVVAQLPSGIYVSAVENIDNLVGRRAQEDILHPLTGQILVEESKLITRSMISQLNETRVQVDKYLELSEQK